MSAWVKCSERMPEYGTEVIGCFDGFSEFPEVAAMAYGSHWQPSHHHRWHNSTDLDDEFGNQNVTHWQPLPAPPE